MSLIEARKEDNIYKMAQKDDIVRIVYDYDTASGNKGLSWYYRKWRKCKGCGEWDLAIYNIVLENFRSDYCLACKLAQRHQKYDAEWIYSEDRQKRLYKRECFICGKEEYVRVNKDGLFKSLYCRKCSNTVTWVLRKGCPFGFKHDDNHIYQLKCLECHEIICYFDAFDIKNGDAEPYKLKVLKK